MILYIILTAIILVELVTIIIISRAKIDKKKENIVSVLTNIKKEDDFIIDREKDDILIDNYLSIVKDIISSYEKSRSKVIAFRTRRKLLYYTIMIIPIISKYTQIDIDYDVTSKILPKRTDKDIMRLLVEAYNSFSKDALESFNDLLLCSLLLSDNK